MSLASAQPQKSRQLELFAEDRGEAPNVGGSVEARAATNETERSGSSDLMAEVLERQNLQAAWKRVKRNQGSPGVDGMTVGELPEYLRSHWPSIREQLQAGSYQPSEVKQQLIPKSGGGMRQLGIPTVLDRFIQQALLQVLQRQYEPTFSEHSYGFRPGKSAHQAVRAARSYVEQGRRVVVDVDLSKFFDRVNHDVLMGRLARRIVDKAILRLIRRYLEAGILSNGVVMERREGTPQGGPLSPLLANILLDEVDQELSKRQHKFARYADDLNVYVRTKRAGERVMAGLRKLFGKLRLVINEDKSAIGSAFQRQFLGFSLWTAPGKKVRHRVSGKALHAMKTRVRQQTRRTRGRNLEQIVEELNTYLRGWKGYFRLAQTPQLFSELDQWIRHRLRAVQLAQWKRGRTVFRELRARGMTKEGAAKVAANTRRWWRNSAMLIHKALPNRYFDQLGLVRLAT